MYKNKVSLRNLILFYTILNLIVSLFVIKKDLAKFMFYQRTTLFNN